MPKKECAHLVIEQEISACAWPSDCGEVVVRGIWDYEEAVEYFEGLKGAEDVLSYVESSARFGFMAPALTDEGLLYFLPRLMMQSLRAVDSELTSGLLNVLCCPSSDDGYGFWRCRLLTPEQIRVIGDYIEYIADKTYLRVVSEDYYGCLRQWRRESHE